MIEGIIFDLDGTLIESNLDFNSLRLEVGCPASADILSYVATLPVLEQAKANQIIIQRELEDANNAKWIVGAQSFLNYLVERQVPVAIVTRNCKAAATMKLQDNGCDIPLLITREDAPAKPDPTSLLMVAQQWNIDVAKITYIGDYLYDVQAANNAGMMSCLYAPGTNPDYAMQANLTFKRFDELFDLLFD